MTLPVQVGYAKTWIEAFVVPGSTPHLISRRWLSQHRCVVNFDPNNLCLESPEFLSVPRVLHSSGHLLLSLVNSSNTLDQHTVLNDYQNSPSSICTDFQKCDEQTMGSMQPKNQVADRRSEPDEERTADSSVVTGGRDPPDDFPVSLDEPNEEITEQWQDGLHEWYICRDDQCSVESTGISRDVSQRRSSHSFCPCLKRRAGSVNTNIQTLTPRERDSHSAAGDVGVVFSQKPSVVAWFQSCPHVPHLFGLPAPRKVDSTDRTHIPGISRVATDGSGVVDKIATTTRMMCWYLLTVGMTLCLDHAVSAPHGADACSINSSFVDTFHVDPWNSRDNVEQRVQRRVRRNRVDLVQLGGQMTNPKDRNTAVKLRGYKIRHVQQQRRATVSDRARCRAKLEESWRPMTLAVIVQNKKSQSLLEYVSDLARDQHRRGGRVFLTFPWIWNVLTTWPLQSVISEAPFLCAHEGKRGILTNCADTACLVGRSRCCKSFVSQRLLQSSLANLFVSHEVCLWNASIQEDSVCSCNPLDDEEATAFPSEEDEAMVSGDK